MAKRLIDADKLRNGIALYMTENSYLNDTPLDVLKMVADWVTNAPTVDAVEVVHGRWKFHEPDKHGNKKPYCTNCGRYPLTNWSDYIRCKVCPNCGAKMDGGEEK